ncbi:hypothetical protein Rs2_46339 [Raphanus sativus]|nr:hypothetical protein Rs2_46339 [Raphanus sativus]
MVVPGTSTEGDEYTILPKTGQVWAIHRFWTGCLDETYEEHVVVEVLDDDDLDYKVLALEPALQFNEDEGERECLEQLRVGHVILMMGMRRYLQSKVENAEILSSDYCFPV